MLSAFAIVASAKYTSGEARACNSSSVGRSITPTRAFRFTRDGFPVLTTMPRWVTGAARSIEIVARGVPRWEYRPSLRLRSIAANDTRRRIHRRSSITSAPWYSSAARLAAIHASPWTDSSRRRTSCSTSRSFVLIGKPFIPPAP
jgi:hypothetical protein